jgi:hypothetical protein
VTDHSALPPERPVEPPAQSSAEPPVEQPVDQPVEPPDHVTPVVPPDHVTPVEPPDHVTPVVPPVELSDQATPAPNAFARAIDGLRARLRIRILRPEAIPSIDLRAAVSRLSAMPRRRLAGFATLAVAGVAAAAVLVVLGVSAVSALSDQFGYHPRDEAAVWAALKPRFAVAGTCANCHSTEGLKHSTSEHDVVPCQSCHGPMEGHDQAGPVSYTALSELQTRELCAACHAKAEGRPKTIAQIDVDTHFTPGACALCHDPHTTNPVRPPKIPHTLDNLPACSVCHGSTGNRPVPATHPVFPSDVCQKCHAPLTPKA